MELYITSRIKNEDTAFEVCRRYLERLPITPKRRQHLLSVAISGEGISTAKAMARLHHAMAGDSHHKTNPAYVSVWRRLELAYGDLKYKAKIMDRKGVERTLIVSTPPINRSSMTPGPWPLNPFKDALYVLKHRVIPTTTEFLGFQRSGHLDSSDSPDPRGYWHNTGMFRRITLLTLVITQAMAATYFMKTVLPYHGSQPFEMAILVLFGILTAWVSAGFWTAMTGFVVLRFGGDRYDISASSVGNITIDTQAKTAIIMPIRNENVPRVFAGLKATYESLAQAGNLEHFDFFVLSDSNDPDARVAENEAWLELCRTVNGFRHIFYRWRQHQIKRKSGNVADFCRRWGNNYRYMVVLDADSVMSGECLAKLVQLMEANPNAGIIQTAPRAVGRETFYARLQQFASSVYGPLFIAGLHFWQLGESHYWGHNAIIRIAPFIKHCALGRLPGTGSLSGDILSHDFVEAALMRRAGWAVWIAYDLPGSYEEMPPNLVDELQRERRWCHGNLMNFRLFLAPGMHPAHRAVFMTGVIAYISAPLWFLFLVLSTWMLATHTLIEPQYFSGPKQLFPMWPEWHPERAIGLFGATTTLLFLPKILSVVHIWLDGAKRFGGLLCLIMSMLVELLVSMLLAPIRMLFHTQFVIAALTGWSIQWKSPPREDAATPWEEAFRRHGAHTLLGLVWAAGVYWLNPAFLWWLLPVVGALILSIPISVLSSRVSLGRYMRKFGFFLIPEEAFPPKELRTVQENIKLASGRKHGFVDAVTEPVSNALACMSGVVRLQRVGAINDYRMHLANMALEKGPTALSDKQKMVLLNDPQALSYLHFQVWTSKLSHPDWLRAS